jgi:hypothetical protein
VLQAAVLLDMLAMAAAAAVAGGTVILDHPGAVREFMATAAVARTKMVAAAAVVWAVMAAVVSTTGMAAQVV